MPAARPLLYVLAGVNGAGKSSVGGHALAQAGMGWFNPDTFTRQLMEATGSPLADANAAAWQEGLRRLEAAIANGTNHAFETTLGGNTIAEKLREAAHTHDVAMWFCGLDSPEHHIARVRYRVSQGGHDIPEAKIRERYESSIQNLLRLLPHLARLRVYDNSADATPGQPIPNPRLLLQMDAGQITWPTNADTLRQTPDWAKPILEMALQLQDSPRASG
jgi:predicted ABC-type ATPase